LGQTCVVVVGHSDYHRAVQVEEGGVEAVTIIAFTRRADDGYGVGFFHSDLPRLND
jgi:hypothetical protein